MLSIIDNLVIEKIGTEFVVRDKKTGLIKSVKYKDEEHALRYAKYLTNFKGDFRKLKVDKTYESKDTVSPNEEAPLYISDKDKKKARKEA